MTVIDGQVWINEIDSWVSTKEYEEYVEYNKTKYNGKLQSLPKHQTW